MSWKLFRYCCLLTAICPMFAKKLVAAIPTDEFPLASLIKLWQVETPWQDAQAQKKHTMRLALANEIGFTNKPQKREQAQVRIVILALVSFLLGVAATAFWFHLASNRTAESLSSQADSQANQPDYQQPAAPPAGANSPARPFVEPPVPVAPAAIERRQARAAQLRFLSVDQGTEILREAALKKYAAAAQELQSQVTRGAGGIEAGSEPIAGRPAGGHDTFAASAGGAEPKTPADRRTVADANCRVEATEECPMKASSMRV